MQVTKSQALKWARIPIVFVTTAFPVVFAHHIEALSPGYLISFLALVLVLAFVEFIYDREASAELNKAHRDALNELENARRKLQFQKMRGLTMGRLLTMMAPIMAIIEHRSRLTTQEKNGAIQTLNQYIVTVLQAACEEVWTYWNSPGDTEPQITGSVMRSIELSTLSHGALQELEGRTKFRSFRRALDTYK
jgi:hypothetical protein